jgi:hypothetical protein
MKTSNKPKRNVWTDPSPYGTYTGERGNPSQWRSEFYQRFTKEEVVEILDKDSPYGILGLKENASREEIQAAFRTSMLKNHPDVGGDTEVAKKIIAAYQHLTQGA